MYDRELVNICELFLHYGRYIEHTYDEYKEEVFSILFGFLGYSDCLNLYELILM